MIVFQSFVDVLNPHKPNIHITKLKFCFKTKNRVDICIYYWVHLICIDVRPVSLQYFVYPLIGLIFFCIFRFIKDGHIQNVVNLLSDMCFHCLWKVGKILCAYTHNNK